MAAGNANGNRIRNVVAEPAAWDQLPSSRPKNRLCVGVRVGQLYWAGGGCPTAGRLATTAGRNNGVAACQKGLLPVANWGH